MEGEGGEATCAESKNKLHKSGVDGQTGGRGEAAPDQPPASASSEVACLTTTTPNTPSGSRCPSSCFGCAEEAFGGAVPQKAVGAPVASAFAATATPPEASPSQASLSSAQPPLPPKPKSLARVAFHHPPFLGGGGCSSSDSSAAGKFAFTSQMQRSAREAPLAERGSAASRPPLQISEFKSPAEGQEALNGEDGLQSADTSGQTSATGNNGLAETTPLTSRLSRVGFCSVRTFDKRREALQLSEAEERELLRLAEEQQHQLSNMRRGRWLQAWVEPSQAFEAQTSQESDGLGQSVFPPFCLPPFRDGDSEGAFPASSQTPFNRQPRRPVLRVGSAATAPQLRRNEKTNAAALSSSTETQAPPPSEEGQLLFLKVQEQRLQSKVRRVTIPLGAFKSREGLVGESLRPVCLRLASSGAEASQREQERCLREARKKQQRRQLLRFLCALEQQILRWSCASSLQHRTLVCHPDALLAASEAAGVPSEAASEAAREGHEHVEFWKFLLEVKPDAMPLAEFVMWCQRPLGMPVEDYVRLLKTADEAEAAESRSASDCSSVSAAGAESGSPLGSLQRSTAFRVLLGGVVNYCQSATDAVGALLEEYASVDAQVRRSLRRQKRLQRRQAVYAKLERTMRSNFYQLAPKYLRVAHTGASLLQLQESMQHGRALSLLQWRDTAPSSDAPSDPSGGESSSETLCTPSHSHQQQQQQQEQEEAQQRRTQTREEALGQRMASPCKSSPFASPSSLGFQQAPPQAPTGAVLRLSGLIREDIAAERAELLARMHRSECTGKGLSRKSGGGGLWTQSGEAHFFYQALRDLNLREAEANANQEALDRRQAAAEFGAFPPDQKGARRSVKVAGALQAAPKEIQTFIHQVLHEESVELFVLKVQTLKQAKLARLAALKFQQRLDCSSGENKTEVGASLLRRAVEAGLARLQKLQQQISKPPALLACSASFIFASQCLVTSTHLLELSPFVESSSLEELLGSGCTYAASEEGQRRASFVIFLLVSLLLQVGDVDFVLPLKASRVFVSNRHLFFKVGLPAEVVWLEGEDGRGEEAVEGRAQSAAAKGVPEGAPAKKFLLSGLRERTAASVLWTETLPLPPGESAARRAAAAASSSVAVEKVHVWLVAALLFRMLARQKLTKGLARNPDQLRKKVASLACSDAARDFLHWGLQERPSQRPSLRALLEHPFLRLGDEARRPFQERRQGSGGEDSRVKLSGAGEARERERPPQETAEASEDDVSLLSAAETASLEAAATHSDPRQEDQRRDAAGEKGLQPPTQSEGLRRNSLAPPSLLPPSSRADKAEEREGLHPSQVQQDPQQRIGVSRTRLLACCDALFGDVGVVVPALIRSRARKRALVEEGVAFYGSNDPLKHNDDEVPDSERY